MPTLQESVKTVLVRPRSGRRLAGPVHRQPRRELALGRGRVRRRVGRRRRTRRERKSTRFHVLRKTGGCGYSVETGRGAAAAETRIFRGSESPAGPRRERRPSTARGAGVRQRGRRGGRRARQDYGNPGLRRRGPRHRGRATQALRVRRPEPVGARAARGRGSREGRGRRGRRRRVPRPVKKRRVESSGDARRARLPPRDRAGRRGGAGGAGRRRRRRDGGGRRVSGRVRGRARRGRGPGRQLHFVVP